MTENHFDDHTWIFRDDGATSYTAKKVSRLSSPSILDEKCGSIFLDFNVMDFYTLKSELPLLLYTSFNRFAKGFSLSERNGKARCAKKPCVSRSILSQTGRTFWMDFNRLDVFDIPCIMNIWSHSEKKILVVIIDPSHQIFLRLHRRAPWRRKLYLNRKAKWHDNNT